MDQFLVMAREMTLAVKDERSMDITLHNELFLIILAKLPVRYLVRLKAISKRYNQMLSSPDALKFIYRNMPLVRTPAFLIDSYDLDFEPSNEPTWVIEPTTSGEFYKVPIPTTFFKGNIIEDACNGIYCFFHRDTDFSGRKALTICNPGTNTLKRLPESTIRDSDFCAMAFDPSTAHLTLLLGLYSFEDDCLLEIYDSQSNAWIQITSTTPNGKKGVEGRGIYSNGSFYWSLRNNNKGVVVGFSIEERLWTTILGPQFVYLPDLDGFNPSNFKKVTWDGEQVYKILAEDTRFPLFDWWLTGTDGRLVLVNKDDRCMWELNEDLLKWCQVHITLPNPVYGVAVNISRWTLAAGEQKIMMYNGKGIVVRTVEYSELDIEASPRHSNPDFSSSYIWPFEWNNVQWP